MTIPKSAAAGRLLMTLCTVGYGFLPPFVDLGVTHVQHPDWTPHSRMHMVWLLATNFGVSVLALYLLWLHGARRLRALVLSAREGINEVMFEPTEGMYGYQ
jgi:drug/metabolite transporter (DMT)-like permease